jgi:hypothetical protein
VACRAPRRRRADRLSCAVIAEFAYPPKPAADELLRAYPDLDSEFVGAYARASQYTMTGVERMYALWTGVWHVARHNVPGAFVECGVWRGGSSMLAADVLTQLGDERELWLYDTYTGMPAPTPGDVDFNGVRAADQLHHEPVKALATLAEVQSNLSGYRNVRFIQGRVEDTIPDQAPDRIALLRLDTDWESSTRHELEYLWPRLAVGGVLIIDDYGHWQGARRAVDEYFAGRADAPLLVRVDYTGRLAVRDRR